MLKNKVKWDYTRTTRILRSLMTWDFERLYRVFLVKPVKIFQNIYYTIIVICGIEERYFSIKNDKIEHIGDIDKNRKIHLYEDKIHYKKLFDERDLYKGGDRRIYRKGKIGLATDGDKIFIFKKIDSVLRYFEYMSELKCLVSLKDCKFVPKIKCVDYENKIIYMQYIDGLVLLNNINILKRRGDSKKLINKLEVAVESIHNNKVFIYDVRDRNIIIKNDNVYFIDFGYSMSCNSCPEFYFKKLKNLDIYNFDKRIKNKLS